VRESADGKRQPVGDAIPNYFPAVVSVETFFEARAAMDGRRTERATKQSERFQVWQGIAKCEHCGGAMHSVNKGVAPRGHTYLHCCNARKGLCKGKVVRMSQAEEVLRGALIRLDSLALVKDSSGAIAKTLRAVEGQLADKRRLLEAYEVQFEQNPESKTIGRVIVKAEAEIAQLEREQQALQADLAAESGIGWDTFMQRLDLVSYEGRARANALLKRLDVQVRIGPSGYAISQGGQFVFGMDYRDGEAGYLMPGFGGMSTFLPVSEVPRHSEREEASQLAGDAIEGQGQPAGEY
jgi:hypothetical protein